jgi:hypothetical protein
MLQLALRGERSHLVPAALALAALVGWASFAYSAISSSGIAAERDEALAQRQKLEQASGDLSQLEAKLTAARIEYGKAVQAWAEARGRIGQAQQELAALARRADQARERVSQTGSIRPAEPQKAPAPAPARKP